MPSSNGDDISGGESIAEVQIVPEAFAELGAKLNEVIRALNKAHIRGSGPIKIIRGSAGKMATLDMDALQKLLYKDPKNASGAGGGGGGSSSFSDEFHFYGGSPIERVDIDAGGVFVARQGKETLLTGNTFLMTFGAVTVEIVIANVTHSMSVREIDVCDAGVVKKMLILASAPY